MQPWLLIFYDVQFVANLTNNMFNVMLLLGEALPSTTDINVSDISATADTPNEVDGWFSNYFSSIWYSRLRIFDLQLIYPVILQVLPFSLLQLVLLVSARFL